MGMGRNKTISDDDLLDVARRAFVEEGFAASTREIARRAGVSEGLIFQRFQTKEDLFFAAMIPPPADLNRLLHHPRSKGRALIEKITFSMIDYFLDTLPVLLPPRSHVPSRFSFRGVRQAPSRIAHALAAPPIGGVPDTGAARGKTRRRRPGSGGPADLVHGPLHPLF